MLPRLYSAISTPAHLTEITVAFERKKTERRTKRLTPGYDDDAGPSSMQLTAPHRAGVHYAIVQYLSHPRPVVLQLRAILHITVENKSLRNRARPMEHEGAARCTRGGIKLLPRLFQAMISLPGWWYRGIDHKRRCGIDVSRGKIFFPVSFLILLSSNEL